MHRFSSKRALWRLRFASLLILLFPWLFIGLFGTLGYGLYHDIRDYVIGSLAFIGGIGLVALLIGLLSLSIRCPLCHAHVFRRTGCSVSGKARRTFGSLRIHVAHGALLRGHYRCPYCGEPCDTTTARR